MTKKYLTFDYGASSGRGIVASFNGRRIELDELHRFSNDPVYAFGHYSWDILRLFHEMKQGMKKLSATGAKDVVSMGVDTWGVDFGLLDSDGRLIGNPLFYRDAITDGEAERVFESVSKRELYERTGIQYLKFNTLFQLTALYRRYPKLMDSAKTLLFMPDLFNYMLTGVPSAEFTMASTSEMLDVRTRNYDFELLEKLGINTAMLQPITMPGRVLGRLESKVADETGLELPVVSVCGHDTGSAYLAVPKKPGERSAYLSCGTWSLLGTETDSPNTSDAAFAADYTNEGGWGGNIRFLKNIMGLWIYGEVRRETGNADYRTLDAEIETADRLVRFIDPDAPEFMSPGHMTQKIADYCTRTGQTPPQSRGETLRCVLESLAMKYRFQLEALEKTLGYRMDTLRAVGGGCKDRLLMKYTAAAIARPVIAGPVEATAIGNVAAQMITMGDLSGVDQARELIADSFDTDVYEITDTEFTAAYERFLKVCMAK